MAMDEDDPQNQAGKAAGRHKQGQAVDEVVRETAKLHKETARINRIIEKEFGQIEPEVWR